MKKKRIFLLIIISFILTGCNFNYESKIMLDGTVREKGNVTTLVNEIYTKEDLEEAGIDKVSTETLKKVVKIYLDSTNIKKAKIKYFSDKITGKASNSYSNLYSYSKNSRIANSLFDEIKVKKKRWKTKIDAEISNFDFGIEDYYGSTVSISLPYKVYSSNADNIDKKTNTYSWDINSDFDGIHLEYSNYIFYTFNIFRVLSYATIYTYITLIIILLAIGLVVYLVLYYYRARNLRNN